MSEVINKIPVISVVGPTASGKTAFSVALAKRIGAEIVSADSMQIYKGMDIASAKPTREEMQGVPHHLIDFLEPSEAYSVARYIKDATEAIKDIHSRGKKVIICGGTGLYVDSLLGNIVFDEQPDNTEVRNKLRLRREKDGIEAIYRELQEIDPETADTLHINNEGRVLRALETYYLTGEKPSVLRARSRSVPTPYNSLYFCLNYKDREILYDRINRRVDIMIENGLVEEAREYFSLSPENTSAQAIGHKEIAGYLRGEITLREAADNLKKATRHYAKRQLTWFRRNENIHNIYCDTFENSEKMVDYAVGIIENSEIYKAGEALE